jgi:acetolactate synthase regulatory subunit
MLSLVDHPYQSVCFELLADAEPGLLPRLLVPFARRDLLPDQMRTRRHGDTVEASLEMAAMPAEMVHLVEGNLRQIVGVRRVSVIMRACVRAAA